MIGGEEEEMLAVGQEAGPAMRGVLAASNLVETCRRSASGADSPQHVAVVRLVNDDVVVVPGSSARIGRVGESGRPGRQLLEFFSDDASAKNPRNFPSADQNGNEAPSVPSSFSGVSSVRDCTQIESRSFLVARAEGDRGAVTGNDRRTGKIAGKVKAQSAPEVAEMTAMCGPARARGNPATGWSSRSARATARGGLPTADGRATGIVAGDGGPALTPEPLLAIQRNSRATSAAFCQRASGFFARQSCTT